MEFVGQASPSGACNLLEVPCLGCLDVDDDEGEAVIGIRPKSSPLPRRKSSVSDEDSEPEPPVCGFRRVSFADAKGLSLVQVKEFETWDVPNLPRFDFSEGDGKDTEDYFLSFLNFSLPLSDEELFIKVRDQKVVLETLELLPGTTILKGVVRVLNISFNKAVYVRTTLDTWSSHFDLLAEYVPGSSDRQMDCFSFKLTLVPPFGDQGTRVDFCLRYETPVETFWANNNNGNYVLFCQQRMREKPHRENLNKRSCLKLVSQNLTGENCSAVEASSQENISPVVSNQLEELNSVKDKRLSDDRRATSQEDEQKLRAENRRNSGRRSHRKAEREALLRDYSAQRQEGANGRETDEFPPPAKQAAQAEDPVEKHSETQSFSEALVPEAAAACSKPLVDTLNETSQAHNYTSVSEPEKSENNSLADSAAVRGGESATRVPDKPEHSNEKSASKAEGGSLKHDVIKTVERSYTITAQENVTLNNPLSQEEERLSDHGDSLQQPAEMIRPQHRCTSSYEVPVSGDEEAPVPEESLCPQGEAQEDNVTFDLRSQTVAEAAQAELPEPECSQIKTDPDATLAQTERQKVMSTHSAHDFIVDKNELTTHKTSLETQIETCDAVEQNNLESYVFEDEIIHPADTEVAAEVAGSMTKADHTHGDTFVQFKDKPIIVSENILHCEPKAAVETLEEFSPAEPTKMKMWETTGMVEEKEKNVLTDEEKTNTTSLKAKHAETVEKDKVGHLEDTGRETAFERCKEREKTQTGGEDKQKPEEEESREAVARTDRNVEKELEYVTQIETIVAENEPAEGCVTEKRQDKRTNVQNKEETEPEKLMEIEARGEAQAGVLWDDPVKPKEDNDNLDYVEEMLVGAGEGRAVDAHSRGVTSEGTDDGAGCFEARQAITQNEGECGLSALVNKTQGEDEENIGGEQHAHVLTETHEGNVSCDSASAESDSDDEVELYMHCLRAVHAGTPAHRDRDVGFTAGRRPSASKSKNLSTHMPPISESLDEEQHLSCLLGNNEGAEKLDVQPTATASPGGQEHVNKCVSCSCSNISKTLLYATSLVVFLVVAYYYDFLACFALYLASVVWLCCQGDARTTRG